VLAQFVAYGEHIRPAVRNAVENTLVHPHYEFFSPREYAVPESVRIAANIRFIAELKRHATADLLATMQVADHQQARKLKHAQDAEQHFLEAYRISLGPVSATEIFRHYDAALALAPWNDSLRSRIALHYRDIADSQANSSVRAYLMKRARLALDNTQSRPTPPMN